MYHAAGIPKGTLAANLPSPATSRPFLTFFETFRCSVATYPQSQHGESTMQRILNECSTLMSLSGQLYREMATSALSLVATPRKKGMRAARN